MDRKPAAKPAPAHWLIRMASTITDIGTWVRSRG
jgi:hypothetical protein